MRIRPEYSKTEAMRFTGHLDLYRTWERLIRRAQLPLAYSQGFNPHPKINMSPALPLGFTSECELIDIWLEVEIDIDLITEKLISASPPGIAIHSVCRIDEQEPALQKILTAATYVIRIETPLPNVDQKIKNILRAENIIRSRRGKDYDLRPLIIELGCSGKGDNCEIYVTLACREGATGRPDELIAELGVPIEQAYIHRTKFGWDAVYEENTESFPPNPW